MIPCRRCGVAEASKDNKRWYCKSCEERDTISRTISLYHDPEPSAPDTGAVVAHEVSVWRVEHALNVQFGRYLGANYDREFSVEFTVNAGGLVEVRMVRDADDKTLCVWVQPTEMGAQ